MIHPPILTTHRGSVLFLALATLVGVLGLAAFGQPPGYPPPTTGAPTGSEAPMASTPSHYAAQLIAEARASFARVKDYMGTLVKEERVNGQMQPEQYVSFRIRQQPFSVSLKWVAPKSFEGQEVTYVAGKNNNRMRAKGAGLAGAIGFVSLDPTDPRANKQSRHAITELGIGNLIETIARNHDAERNMPPNQVQTTFREFMFQQRPCIGMEVTHLVNNGQFYCYRCSVYFDRVMRLPVRFEAYDWPVAGGAPQGEKLECYSYIDLKFNVGLNDAAFGM